MANQSAPATIPVTIDSGNLMMASMNGIIQQLEDQILSTKASQSGLNDKITSLADFLHDFNEAEGPYDMQIHVDKLHDVKRRVTNVDAMLGNIHDRLSRLQRQIAREVYNKKKIILGNVPIPPEN